MKLLLPMCGMTAEDAGCHSFRRGTATGLAHINAPSYVVKGIGMWGSDAYLGYVGATESGAMEQAMLAMARPPGPPSPHPPALFPAQSARSLILLFFVLERVFCKC